MEKPSLAIQRNCMDITFFFCVMNNRIRTDFPPFFPSISSCADGIHTPFKIPLHWKRPSFATIQKQISLLLHFCVLAVILRDQNVVFHCCIWGQHWCMELQSFQALAVAWLSGCPGSSLLILPLKLENSYLLGKLHLWP